MSSYQDVLDFFVKLLVIFGVSSLKWTSKKQIGRDLLLLILPIHMIFLTTLAYFSDGPKDGDSGFQLVPAGCMVVIKIFNVKTNFGAIVLLIKNMKNTLSRYEESKILKKSHSQAVNLIKFCVLGKFVPLTIEMIVALIMHKNLTSVWIPDGWMEYERSFFYFYWLFYSFCGIFISLLALTIDFLQIYLLILINAFAKCLTKSFESMSNVDGSERNEQFISLISQIDELKR